MPRVLTRADATDGFAISEYKYGRPDPLMIHAMACIKGQGYSKYNNHHEGMASAYMSRTNAQQVCIHEQNKLDITTTATNDVQTNQQAWY